MRRLPCYPSNPNLHPRYAIQSSLLDSRSSLMSTNPLIMAQHPAPPSRSRHDETRRERHRARHSESIPAWSHISVSMTMKQDQDQHQHQDQNQGALISAYAIMGFILSSSGWGSGSQVSYTIHNRNQTKLVINNNRLFRRCIPPQMNMRNTRHLLSNQRQNFRHRDPSSITQLGLMEAPGEDWESRKFPDRNQEEVANTKIVVAGGGSFGTAMATVFASNGYPVTILLRKQNVADEINIYHKNTQFFPDFELNPSITATINPAEAFRNADLIVHAIPVQATRTFLEMNAHYMPPNVPILCTSKGLEVRELKLMCELLPDLVGKKRAVAYLSGPSFAKEMMQQLPTAVVIASKDPKLAQKLAGMLSNPYFRVFTSKDVVGLEVAGAVKNVIAIAAGICEGLQLGMNAMAALVTRGCSEMRRVAVEKGGSAVTLSGLSGVGDAFLTCFGPLSRNRTVGVRLGKGETLQDILATSREVAEGVETASALVRWLAKKGSDPNFNPYASRACVKYPILFGVAAILEGRITPREGLGRLLAMPPKPED